MPGKYSDISLESPDRKIIIETNYYVNARSDRLKASYKFSSKNLNQLYAYLPNIEFKVQHPATPIAKEFYYTRPLSIHSTNLPILNPSDYSENVRSKRRLEKYSRWIIGFIN